MRRDVTDNRRQDADTDNRTHERRVSPVLICRRVRPNVKACLKGKKSRLGKMLVGGILESAKALERRRHLPENNILKLLKRCFLITKIKKKSALFEKISDYLCHWNEMFQREAESFFQISFLSLFFLLSR